MPPQSDLYKPLGAGTAMPSPSIPAPSKAFTPELPGQRRKQTAGTPWALVAVGGLVAAAGVAYMLTNGGAGKSESQLANLTKTAGQTAETTQEPTSSFMPTEALQPPPVVGAAAESSSSVQVSFADVPPDQANQPIVADGKEAMPKGLFGELTDAIQKERDMKASGTAPTAENAPPASENALTQEKLKQELEAYKTALAGSSNPSDLKPETYSKNPAAYAPSAAQTDEQVAKGALLAPPQEAFVNNPKNLPVVAEPLVNAPPKVRTLADFPDVEPYMPEREKVQIPTNLKPKLAATDFPSLEVLSFVPGQGIVAFTEGREGVLLIGESLNGWELVAVTADNAQFKAGEKSHDVSAN